MAEDRRPLPGRAGGRPPGWLRRAAEGGAAREEPHVARVPEDAALEALPDREAQLLVEDRHRLAAQRVALLRLRAERVLIEPSHGGGAAGVEAVLEEELRARAAHRGKAQARAGPRERGPLRRVLDVGDGLDRVPRLQGEPVVPPAPGEVL